MMLCLALKYGKVSSCVRCVRSLGGYCQYLLQISIHLQRMGKIGPFGKSRKVFWPVQNGPKGFLERKRTSFRTKTQ
jgi:hypothetical protein